jgi:outer membrane murein-binding lipoprotein Lpp
MNRIAGLLIIVASFYLAGCASGPKYTEISSSISTVSQGQGRLFIYRKTALGAAVQPEVRIDDEVVGKAVPKGFFYVDRAPGHYKVETSTEVDRALSLTLEAGETRYVRLNIGIGFFVGHVYPELVDDAVGMKEIQDCSYTGVQ